MQHYHVYVIGTKGTGDVTVTIVFDAVLSHRITVKNYKESIRLLQLLAIEKAADSDMALTNPVVVSYQEIPSE